MDAAIATTAATEAHPRRVRPGWTEAIGSLTEAFSEDPCLAWLLDSPVYDPAKACHIHEYTLRVASLWGRTWVAGPRSEGVCLWLPRGGSRYPPPCLSGPGASVCARPWTRM